MKENRIAEILGMVDEKYIEEAAPVSQKNEIYGWKKWRYRLNRAGKAAAVVLAAGISLYALRTFVGPNVGVTPGMEQTTEYDATGQEETLETEPVTPPPMTATEPATPPPTTTAEPVTPPPTTTAEPVTPPITTTEPDTVQYHEDGREMLSAEMTNGGMGFEGEQYYDISESAGINPWSKEAELKTLPVYRNLAYDNGPGYTVYLSEEELLLRAEQVAEALNTEIRSYEYRRVEVDYEPAGEKRGKAYGLDAATGLGRIDVSGSGGIRIFFEEAVALPQEYHFTYHETTDNEAAEALDYLVKRYEKLLDFKRPVAGSRIHYNLFGEQIREYSVYEDCDTLTEQIISYNFAGVEFSPNEENKLYVINLRNKLDSAEKIGDYPIISWEEAQQLLLNGDYITTVPREYLEDGVVKEQHIAKVELVYRTGSYDKVHMPYYRFQVELAMSEWFYEKLPEGLISYGAFYVPAVSGEYLTDFPVWGGEFN